MKKIYIQPETKLAAYDLDLLVNGASPLDPNDPSNLPGNPGNGGEGGDDEEEDWGAAKDRNIWGSDLW